MCQKSVQIKLKSEIKDKGTKAKKSNNRCEYPGDLFNQISIRFVMKSNIRAQITRVTGSM